MKLIVNEEEREFDDRGGGGLSLSDLLVELGAPAERVAVAVNGQVIPRQQRAGRVLREGDRIDVIAFVGGG